MHYPKLCSQPLTVAAWIPAHQFHTTALVNGGYRRVLNASIPYLMFGRIFKEVFKDMWCYAATIQKIAASNSIDSFLKAFGSDSSVKSLKPDGYILTVDKSPLICPKVQSYRLRLSSCSCCLLHVCYILSAFPYCNTLFTLDNDLKVFCKTFPWAFIAAPIGLFVEDSQTVFYHPGIALKMLPIFIATD